jgi:hypothetical protein
LQSFRLYLKIILAGKSIWNRFIAENEYLHIGCLARVLVNRSPEQSCIFTRPPHHLIEGDETCSQVLTERSSATKVAPPGSIAGCFLISKFHVQEVLEERFMSKSLKIFAIFLAIGVSLGATVSVQAQDTVPVTTVITVLGPKFTPPPALSKEDISVYESKNKRTVTGFLPAQGDKAGLQLAIVIDDASTVELGSQLGDIRNFITAQPKSTSIGVFYASNGGVQATSPFSADHDAAAKGVRLPFGSGGAYSSVYLSVMSLIGGWSAPAPSTRREILLIADGIDRFRGDPFSPDIQATYEKAEKAGIIIHTLYATGVGRVGRNSFRVSYGQSNLDQLSERTGGESFFQGLQTPISFSPFLEQLDMILKNQYFLTFNTAPAKNAKGQLRSFKIRTELKNVDISSADQVFVRGAAK